MTYEFVHEYHRYEYDDEMDPKDALFNRTQYLFCQPTAPGHYVDMTTGEEFLISSSPSGGDPEIRVISRLTLLDKW